MIDALYFYFFQNIILFIFYTFINFLLTFLSNHKYCSLQYERYFFNLKYLFWFYIFLSRWGEWKGLFIILLINIIDARVIIILFFRVTLLIGMITKIYKIQEVQYYKMKRKHLQWYMKQYFLKAK